MSLYIFNKLWTNYHGSVPVSFALVVATSASQCSVGTGTFDFLTFFLRAMKRKSSGADKVVRCKEAYEALVLTTFTEPLNTSLIQHIQRKVDATVQLRKRKDPTVCVFYPKGLLFPILKNKPPQQLKMRTSWCGTT